MKRNLWGRAFGRSMTTSTAVLAVLSVLLPTSVLAEETLLVRKTIQFEECKSRVMAVPVSLGALPERVSIVRDTGAEFHLKIAARAANLVMACNKVSDQMEVYRTTPGDAPPAKRADVAMSSG
ncbi:MAG: hypothetical protein AAF141_01920 [Pseudomonadota bacterium]